MSDDMGTGEVVRKAGGRRSYEEVRGRWDAARKEVERRLALRKGEVRERG